MVRCVAGRTVPGGRSVRYAMRAFPRYAVAAAAKQPDPAFVSVLPGAGCRAEEPGGR